MRTEMASPPARFVVNGPTMGTRYSAAFYAAPGSDRDAIAAALADAVGEVDCQMSTWSPRSDLMRFNLAPVGEWVDLPAHLLTVMEAGLDIGRASAGAFDIGLLDHVRAWGFQSHDGSAASDAIARLCAEAHAPAYERIVLDRARGRAVKLRPSAIDLSGIAKGYGVDRLAETLLALGIVNFLVSIDGELRAAGGKPDGEAWHIAIERPDPTQRDIAGIVDLVDGAIATSGNYRHRRELNGRSYSHTIDPRTGEPIPDRTASATVRAPTCMEADAWATVVMVLGEEAAGPLLAERGLSAITVSLCQRLL